MAHIIRNILAHLCVAILITPAYTQGSADSLWQLFDLEDVVITAQYAPTHYKNADHTVRIISNEKIQQLGLLDLSEVMYTQLNVTQSVDPILGNGLSIQGIGGENIQLLIDGIPVIGRRDGNIDLSQINMQNVERIEIIEGAMSAQYGSNAAGGVINVITKKSQVNPFSIKASSQYESIGNWNHQVQAGYRWKNIYVRGGLNYFDSEFIERDSLRLFETVQLSDGREYSQRKYPWNPKTQHNYFIGADVKITDSIKIGYTYRTFDEDVAIYGPIRRPQFRPYALDEYFFTKRKDHAIHGTAYLSSRYYLESTTGFNQFERLNETRRLDIAPDTFSLFPGGQDTATFYSFTQRTSLSYLANAKWKAQVGFQALYERGSGARLVDTAATDAEHQSLSTYAGWVSATYSPTTTISIQGNARLGYHSIYSHPIVPSVHVNWQPTNRFRMRASFAKGFRSPSLKELYFRFIDINHYIIGNPTLTAERSTNYSLEPSYRWELANDWGLEANGKLFQNRITDRITLAEYTAAEYQYLNLDEFKTRGYAVRLQVTQGKTWDIQAGYGSTWISSEISADVTGDDYIRQDQWSGQIKYSVPKIHTTMNVAMNYTGKDVIFSYNAEDELQKGTVEDMLLMNISISQPFWKNRIRLTGGCKNVLDVTRRNITGSASQGIAHNSSIGSRLFSPGRNYFAQLAVSF